MREQHPDRQTEIHTDRQTDRQTDGAKILYRYQVSNKIWPKFLVPDKTSNNASRSTKIVSQCDCSILTKF